MIPWPLVIALMGAWLLSIAHAATHRRPLAWLACGLCWIVVLAALLLLIARGITGGHWPLGTRQEYMLAYLLLLLLVTSIWTARWREHRATPWILPVALGLAVSLALSPEEASAVRPLPPALRSPLLQVHVLTILLADTLLTVAGGLAMGQIVRPAPGDRCHWLPPDEETETRMTRLVSLAVPWLAVGILLGAVWARDAWGSYWSWDPKETWALITLLWYQMPLHLKALPRRRHTRVAWLVLVGMLLVLFTLVGVPQVAGALSLDSLHGY